MGDTHHSDESVLLSGTDEIEIANAEKQLHTLLSASTMGEMIEAVSRGIKHRSLKVRETCSVAKDQKFKSISRCWFAKTKDRHGDGVSMDGTKFIIQNMLVWVKLAEGKNFVS